MSQKSAREAVEAFANELAIAHAWVDDLVEWVQKRLPSTPAALIALRLAALQIDANRPRGAPSVLEQLALLEREGILRAHAIELPEGGN